MRQLGLIDARLMKRTKQTRKAARIQLIDATQPVGMWVSCVSYDYFWW